MKTGFKFTDVLFTCVDCNKQVFKQGKRVNLTSKLCGYCNSLKKGKKELKDKTVISPKQNPVELSSVNPDKITVDDVFRTPNPPLEFKESKDNTQAIVERVSQYHSLLSRVIELLSELKPDHNETFLSLWTKAKQDLNG